MSGIQHFSFCRRQWALIHVEGQWRENPLTAAGRNLHELVHDANYRTTRSGVTTIRALPVRSYELGIYGVCDAVEFQRGKGEVSVRGIGEACALFPVEYKNGSGTALHADSMQLCLEALCLEEMFQCHIPEGAVYYGALRRRTSVEFNESLRAEVKSCAKEMHELMRRAYTPKVRKKPHCRNCSLKTLCLPEAFRTGTVADYLRSTVEDAK